MPAEVIDIGGWGVVTLKNGSRHRRGKVEELYCRLVELGSISQTALFDLYESCWKADYWLSNESRELLLGRGLISGVNKRGHGEMDSVTKDVILSSVREDDHGMYIINPIRGD